MRNLVLGLAAVAMLTMFAAPAMAAHRHHAGCVHWSTRGHYSGYSRHSYFPAPHHRRVYNYYPRPVRYGHHWPATHYTPYATSGFGFSNNNFSFWLGH